MSQERVFHTLTKKSPPCFSTAHTRNRDSPINVLCPQVREFKTGKSLDHLYIRNINTDYGKLKRPNHYYFEETLYQKVLKMTESQVYEPLFEQPPTKRFKGIAALIDDSSNQKQTTNKKSIKRVTLQINQTVQNRQSTQKSGNKKLKIKLNEVAALSSRREKKENNSKKIHSRIVTMVRPGISQTKVISYPDKSDYLNLISR